MLPRLLVLACVASLTATPAAGQDDRQQALSAATRDLCQRQIVVLGEPGTHGSGETLAFKAALVERLVRRCGFSAVLFESGFYDFAAFNRHPPADRSERRARIASSVGRLWTRDREFIAVLDFLTDRTAAGRLTVGGLGNAVGSAGAFYSLDRMPEEFAGHDPAETRAPCREAFRRRITYDYPDDQPYTPAQKATVLTCIDTLNARALAADPVLGQMVGIFRSTVAADFGDWAAPRQASGTAMFDNVQWHLRRLPPRTKVIIWTATVHGARSTAMDDRWRAVDDLGAQLSRAYGDRLFVLGFTAAGGSYLEGGPTPKVIEPAPPQSLEAVVLGDARAVTYVGPARLAALAARSSTMFSPGKRLTARWRDAVDGVVVFRTDRPPDRRTP